MSLAQTHTSPSLRSYGSGRSRTALTMLKMAVLAPMPSDSMTTARMVRAG